MRTVLALEDAFFVTLEGAEQLTGSKKCILAKKEDFYEKSIQETRTQGS